MRKLREAYIVKIHSGSFTDIIVSVKTSPQRAIADGLAWYRKAACRPDSRPTITAEPTMIYS